MDLSHRLPLPSYDRDLTLEELVKGIDHNKLSLGLQTLLGVPFKLVSVAGSVVLGEAFDTAISRLPVRSDMEPVGYLETQLDADDRLGAAVILIEIILRSSARYLMTSDLHLNAVQSDYEEIEKEHRALVESEARYKELAKNLELRVQEQVKTIESAQRQLYQAEKMASVGQLAAGVAHEINNPIGFIKSNLTTAQSYVQTLKSFAEQMDNVPDADDFRSLWKASELDFVVEDFQTLLRESSDGTERVACIVKDLKGFSNVDRSEEEIVDINECIRSACNLSRREIEKHAELVLELNTLPRTRCHPGHLGQAILNLLLNAAKAFEESGQIRVETFMDDKRIGIHITDNGKGIPGELLQRVFDPFFTTSNVGQGTGLGLTVTRDIIHAHHGEIAIDSKVGEGTRVTIKLPVVRK